MTNDITSLKIESKNISVKNEMIRSISGRLRNRETNSIKRVKPLFPIVFEYKTDETTEEKINKLKKFGWDIEMWGENSLSVKAGG